MAAPPTSAQYSVTFRVEIEHLPGMLGRVATAIGGAGGTIGAVDLVRVDDRNTVRDITVQTAGTSHWQAICEAINRLECARVVDTTDRTFRMHLGGKIEVRNRAPINTRDD